MEADPDLIGLFILPLADAGIDYMISGSVAAIHYGEPRSTLDIDSAISLTVDSAPRIGTVFAPPDYYAPPLDVLLIELRRPIRAHFNVIHIPSGLKADFYPGHEHPYFPWAQANRKRVEIDGHWLSFAPPEYVILWKLEFLRESGGEKHASDIRGILQVQGEAIDRALISKAADELQLTAYWQQCLGV